MRLYGEIRSGALSHLASKVIGYSAEPRELSNVGTSAVPAGAKRRIRVWDEQKGAYFLQDE